MVRNASNAVNVGPPWTLRVRKHGTIRQLQYWTRHGRWPIVGVFVPEMLEHHAVVVIDVIGDRVRYFDPDPTVGRQLRTMSKDRFFQWWLSPVTAERWWAVINGGQLIDQK
jgi:hypothetical protein